MFGGGQRVVYDLYQQITLQGGNASIKLLGSKTNRFDDLRPDIFPYDGKYNHISSIVRCAWRVRRSLGAERASLVHSHGWDADIIGWLARWGMDLPLVVHLHVMPEWLRSKYPKHVARRALTRIAFMNSNSEIVAVSEAVRQHWERYLPLSKKSIRVIKNGVNTDTYYPIGADTHRPGECPIIGIASRLVRSKGIENLLDSLALLSGEGISFRLHIAGEGSIQPDLERQIRKLGIQKHVSFLGQLENMPEFYRGIDIFVCPSHTEGMPIVVLEAMATGKPVIATRVGGIPEAFRDGVDGILVPSGDLNALVGALRQLCLDEDLRRQMGEKALERARTCFSIERFYREVTDVYKEVLRKRMETAA